MYNYDYNKNKYIIHLIDTNGIERYRSISFSFLKTTNIVIYLIDLTDFKEISEEFINRVKEYLKDNSFIYVVGNKLDLTEENIEENINLYEEYKINIQKYRKQAKSLIENKVIDKYFEVSAKNKKGIDILMKNIKLYMLRNKSLHNNIYLNETNLTYINNKLYELNKFLNF